VSVAFEQVQQQVLLEKQRTGNNFPTNPLLG